jgi:hypothetical protein
MEPLADCALNYYYIPCPTYSWFWGIDGYSEGDIVGSWFQVGDLSMFGRDPCDPVDCHTLYQFRILDLAGYGVPYPSLHEVEFDVYCCDDQGCPVGPSLWNSGAIRAGYAWNYISVEPTSWGTTKSMYR